MTTARSEPRPATDTNMHAPRSLALFVFLAYAVSWTWLLPLALTGRVVRQGDAWPTHFPSPLGPMVAALIVTAINTGRVGISELVRPMARWRVSRRWWMVALSPFGYLAAALIVVIALWRPLPSAADFGVFSGLPTAGYAVVFAVLVAVNGLGEETG